MKTTILSSNVLQIGDSSFNVEELSALLIKYQMLPQLVREVIIDKAIAPIECTKEEHATALQRFYTLNQLTAEPQLKAWLSERGMTIEHLEALVLRQVKLNKFKQQTWGAKVESYFLKRKTQLDQVTYSLLQTQDPGLAQELYFRIRDDKESFEEMGRQHPGMAHYQLIGPVEIEKHPLVAQVLKKYKPGQPCSPIPVNNRFMIVRVEQVAPAQLDEAMQQRLLDEMLTKWVQEQLPQTVIKVRKT